MTEKLYRGHGPGYRRYAKRKWRRFVRREVRRDPENAPTRLFSKGWV